MSNGTATPDPCPRLVRTATLEEERQRLAEIEAWEERQRVAAPDPSFNPRSRESWSAVAADASALIDEALSTTRPTGDER